MTTKDAIQVALASEIDWAKFEQIVVEILRDDDLSSIRKVGGGSDKGLDGVQESFFGGESQGVVAVQITSQKTQRLKVADTLSKLLKHSVVPVRLVIVFRDECSAPTRAAIKAQGTAAGIVIDVRDQSYLVTELGRSGSTVFKRHLGDDLRRQVDQLLGDGDPLESAPDQLKLSVLASFGAFTLSQEGRLTRGRLFDQTVLAIIASGSNVDQAMIGSGLKDLIPGYEPDAVQILAAISRLKDERSITERAGTYVASDAELRKISLTAKQVKAGFDSLMDYVLDAVKQRQSLTDAAQGYLERNCRKALVQLIRLMGPGGDAIQYDNESDSWLLGILGRDLSPDIAKYALVAITSFQSNPVERLKIAPLIRAYAILALRNLDPVGRRWQSAALSRSMIVLDTDAVLNLLVEELPLQNSLLKAVRAFSQGGVRVKTSDRVVAEVLLHLQSAHRTYNRFGGDAMLRLNESFVFENVWNALARGYWYARAAKPTLTWSAYMDKYLDPNESLGYLKHILRSRVAGLLIEEFDTMNDEDAVVLLELTKGALERRERKRLKSQFRDSDELRDRLEADLKVILVLARAVESTEGFGYLISEDGSFWVAEESEEWGARPRVAVRTRTLPELAELCCGTSVDDDTVVRLVFEPVMAAVGELMREDVETLARLGVDVRNADVLRLQWTLEKGLREKVHAFVSVDAAESVSREKAALDVLEAAAEDLILDPSVERLVSKFKELESKSDADSTELVELRRAVKDVLFAVAGDSNKGRARARHAMKDLGLDNIDNLTSPGSE